ncbi:MAG TPA: SCO family protein [Burkholderiales bacterium]|nr:SCO family protein [Burkholderiales bacterium]
MTAWRCVARGVLLACLVCATAPAYAAQDQAVSANPTLSVIGRAPDFALKDPGGDTVRLAAYRGRVVLLAFVFTTCPGVCPVISQQMAGLQARLKRERLFGDKAAMLSVTVDPDTDSAEVLAKYAGSFGADPAGWRFLREDGPKLDPVLKAYDEWTKLLPPGRAQEKAQLDHPARVYLIDPAGNIREIYSLAFFNDKQALLDMKKLLSEAR